MDSQPPGYSPFVTARTAGCGGLLSLLWVVSFGAGTSGHPPDVPRPPPRPRASLLSPGASEAETTRKRPFRPRPGTRSAPESPAWPAWRGRGGQGIWEGAPFKGPQRDFALEAKWRVQAGGGWAGPAFLGNQVFLFDRPEDAETERVRALDAETGRVLWSREYPASYGDLDYGNGPRATPAIAGSKVVTVGAMGRVHCWDRRDGRVLWAHELTADFDARAPIWGYAASPVIAGELVILVAGARPKGTVLALDLETGKERWRALEDRPGYSTPALRKLPSGRTELVVWTADAVHGLDPRSGAVSWSVPFRTSNYDVAIHSPAVRGDRVFVSGYWDGSVAFRIDPQGSPRVLWHSRVPSCLMAAPLVTEKTLLALDKRRGLLCLDWESGEVLWSDGHAVTPPDRNPHASLVWTDGGLIAGINAEGELLLAEARPSGLKIHARKRVFSGEERIWAHPAFAGSRIYARGDGRLVLLEVTFEAQARPRGRKGGG